MRLPRRKSPFILVFVTLLCAGTYMSETAPTSTNTHTSQTLQSPAPPEQAAATVVKVADTITQSAIQHQPGQYPIVHYTVGDTITVNMNGKYETIRFVSVDTPETYDPRKPVQYYGPAAAAYTKDTISAARAGATGSRLAEFQSRAVRPIIAVCVLTGRHPHQPQLIKNGYSFYYPYFPFSKSDDFATAEQSAQASFRGCGVIATR